MSKRALPLLLTAVVLGLLAGSTSAQAAPILHLVDFIPDGARTHFNGFEGIPNDGTHYTGGAGPYVEGGVSVQQFNGDGGNDIWVTYFSPEGDRGWYPDGGDSGYTRITRAGGIDFQSVGLLRSSGWLDNQNLGLYFELYDNGGLVLSGTIPHGDVDAGLYLGWSGGGFDEIRFRDSTDPGVNSLSGFGLNALAIDAIELADQEVIPEPASLLLLGSGLSMAAMRARSRRRSR